MKFTKLYALPVLAALAIGGAAAPAMAQGNDEGSCMHSGRMMQMMRHGQDGMRGGPRGPGGPGGPGAMAHMLKDMDADEDGKTTPEEIKAGLAAKLAEFDANGDGSLSIGEFEPLHSAAIREKMVDRFQNLDADGDGQVTSDEFAEIAERIGRRASMMGERRGHGGMMGGPGGHRGMGEHRGPGAHGGQGHECGGQPDVKPEN